MRPIGIGDVADRLSAKVMIYITGDDVQLECSSDQICSGLKSGIEGSIHSMRNLFDEQAQDGYGLLLMDAVNAFNSMSRLAAIWNTSVLWPRCARFVFNSYRGYAVLYIAGSKQTLLSKEGVTQGDPLAMLVYGLGILPQTRKLKNPSKHKQNWYANDSGCFAQLLQLKEWLELLIIEGPKYGYFPEPHKSYLVVHPDFVEEAKEMFKDLKVIVVTGQKFLGGFIGGLSDLTEWMEKKVEIWANSVKKLTEVAKQQPQSACVAFTKSLQCEWTYVQRVISNSGEFFSPLKSVINEYFIPALFGSDVDTTESELFCRPVRVGGLCIHDPVKTSQINFTNSSNATRILSKAISEGSEFNLTSHEQMVHSVIKRKTEVDKDWIEDSQRLLSLLPIQQRRCVLRKLDYKCSGWLSVVPTEYNHFDMSPCEFRDSLALRYGRLPIDLPATCDADGKPFDVTHALNCSRGGLVYARHNELRDLNCSLLELAGLKQIIAEPIIQEHAEEDKMLRADWKVRGFWEPQKDAFFDGCILNAESPSLAGSSVESLFTTRKTKKNNLYLTAAKARRATFTPIIATCDAVFDKDSELYFKRMAIHLSKKWESIYSQTLGYLRARMQVCILRSVSLCLRGSRTKWRGAGIQDAASLPMYNLDG